MTSRTSTILAAVLLLACLPIRPVRADDKPDPIPTPDTGSGEVEVTAPELGDVARDPGFDSYLDTAKLAEAWKSLDQEQLTDLAIQLAEGERILLRPHKAIKSEQIFRIATRVAAERRDGKTLDRLTAAANRYKLKELEGQIAAAKQLTAAPRAANPAQAAFKDDAADGSDAEYKSLLADIERARLTGDAAAFDALAKQIAAAGVDAKLRTMLAKELQEARAAVSKDADPDAEALQKLIGDSRGTDAQAAFEGAMGRLAKEYVIRYASTFPVDGSDNWGNKIEKKIWNPIKFKHENISKNHGVWTKYHVELNNPRDNLYIEINKTKVDVAARKVSFQVYARFSARASYEVQSWSWGVKLASATTKARTDVKLWVNITVAFKKSGSNVNWNVNASSADFRWENFVLDRVGALGGEAAKVFGDAATGAFRFWTTKSSDKLQAQVRQAIIDACIKEGTIYNPMIKMVKF